MLPNLKQRLWILLTVLVGGVALVWVSRLLASPEGTGGVLLFQARVGPALGVLLLILAALPAGGLSVVTSAAGNALGGVFAFAAALAVLGIAGGPTSGWLWSGPLPAGYWLLLAELVLWAGGLAGLMALIEWTRPKLQARLAKPLLSDQQAHESSFRWPGRQGWLGCGVAALVGGVLANLLLRDVDTGQVTGALVLAFALGGLVARASTPTASAAGIMLSPCLVGLLSYGLIAMQYLSADQLLAAWYRGDLIGLGLALPIHYASAGVAGACLGVGLGQSVEQLYLEAVAESATGP